MEGVFWISVMVLIVCTFGRSSNTQTTLNSYSSDDNETLIDELEKHLRSDLVDLGDYDVDGNSIDDKKVTKIPYSTAIPLQLSTSITAGAMVKTDKKTSLPNSSLESVSLQGETAYISPLPTEIPYSTAIPLQLSTSITARAKVKTDKKTSLPNSSLESVSLQGETAYISSSPDTTKAVTSPALKRIRGIPKNSSIKVNNMIDDPLEIDNVATSTMTSSSSEVNTRTYWFTNPFAETITFRDTEEMTPRVLPTTPSKSPSYSYPLIILILVVLLLPGIALVLFLIYFVVTDSMLL